MVTAAEVVKTNRNDYSRPLSMFYEYSNCFHVLIVLVFSSFPCFGYLVTAQSTDAENGGGTVPINVGLVLNTGAFMGTRASLAINISHSDFYVKNPDFKTRLVLHVRDSKNDVLTAAAAGFSQRFSSCLRCFPGDSKCYRRKDNDRNRGLVAACALLIFVISFLYEHRSVWLLPDPDVSIFTRIKGLLRIFDQRNLRYHTFKTDQLELRHTSTAPNTPCDPQSLQYSYYSDRSEQACIGDMDVQSILPEHDVPSSSDRNPNKEQSLVQDLPRFYRHDGDLRHRPSSCQQYP